MKYFDKLIKWYDIHCDGEWEHGWGIKIETIDNPGFSVRIGLANTCLDGKSYEKKVDNNEFDWYIIETKKNFYYITCSTNNLEKSLELFFEDFLKNNIDEDFKYIIYLPATNSESYFLKAYAILTSDLKFKLIDIPEQKIIFSKYKISEIDQEISDIKSLNFNFRVGDIVECSPFNIIRTVHN